MMFRALPLAGAWLVDLEKREDGRGFFARSFCAQEFAAQGLNTTWLQMNISFTRDKGTVRGMHFQRPPMSEVKAVRCLRGSVLDVIVDLRAGSDTFGHTVAVELSADNRTTLYVPEGFAHGFQTLMDNVELQYFHSKTYSREHEGGVSYADPSLRITWPLLPTNISPRDRLLPLLAQLDPIEL